MLFRLDSRQAHPDVVRNHPISKQPVVGTVRTYLFQIYMPWKLLWKIPDWPLKSHTNVIPHFHWRVTCQIVGSTGLRCHTNWVLRELWGDNHEVMMPSHKVWKIFANIMATERFQKLFGLVQNFSCWGAMRKIGWILCDIVWVSSDRQYVMSHDVWVIFAWFCMILALFHTILAWFSHNFRAFLSIFHVFERSDPIMRCKLQWLCTRL